jgi:AraC-like DNA-binding protein
MQACYTAIVHLNNGVAILNNKFNGDTSLFAYALANVADELFSNDFRYECVYRAPDLICLMFNEPDGDKGWKQLKERFGMLSRVVATYLELDIAMAMQAKPEHLLQLSRTVMSLLAMVHKQEHRLPNGRLLLADGVEDPHLTLENDWTEWLEQEWFSGGSQPEKDRIVRVYHELERRTAPYKQALETSYMLLGFMLQYTASYPGVVAALYRKEPEMYSRLQMLGSIADLERYMVRIWDEIECLIHNSRPPEIEKSIRYIHSHLSDHDLGLESTAAHVNISRNHFSRIFKEHTNETFNKYVTNARIQLAEHLYRTTELKVYEIADKVGYPNWRYFSKVYRKVKGKQLSQLNAKQKSGKPTLL